MINAKDSYSTIGLFQTVLISNYAAGMLCEIEVKELNCVVMAVFVEWESGEIFEEAIKCYSRELSGSL